MGEGLDNIAVSDDGLYIVATTSYKDIFLFEKNVEKARWTYKLNTTIKDIKVSGLIEDVAISKDGNYIVVGSELALYLFSLDTSIPIWTYTPPIGPIIDVFDCVDITPSGDYILASYGNKSSSMFLFSPNQNTPRIIFNGALSVACSISNDGQFIATSGSNAENTDIYYYRSNQSSYQWKYGTQPIYEDVRDSAISGNGEYIAAVAANHFVYFFHRENSTPIWTFDTGERNYEVAISDDGSRFVVGSRDEILLFGKESPEPIWRYKAGRLVNDVDISADGRYVAAGTIGGSGKLYLFEGDDGEPLWVQQKSVIDLEIARNGRYVAAALDDGYVYLFPTEKKTSYLPAFEAPSAILAVLFVAAMAGRWKTRRV